MKFMFVVLLIACAGCAQEIPEQQKPEQVVFNTFAVVKSCCASPTYVAEIYLSDGTRCTVVSGTYKGGIACDWRH